jgi:hypothetical protein
MVDHCLWAAGRRESHRSASAKPKTWIDIWGCGQRFGAVKAMAGAAFAGRAGRGRRVGSQPLPGCLGVLCFPVASAIGGPKPCRGHFILSMLRSARPKRKINTPEIILCRPQAIATSGGI